MLTTVRKRATFRNAFVSKKPLCITRGPPERGGGVSPLSRLSVTIPPHLSQGMVLPHPLHQRTLPPSGKASQAMLPWQR